MRQLHRAQTYDPPLRLAGLIILCALVSFLLQVFVFTSDHRPDEWRAFARFLTTITGSIGQVEELWVRVCLTSFNIAMVGLLCVLRLINRDTLVLALVWPLTLFLFSKIYWEFFVFPLCLVRTDLRPRAELGFIALLSLLIATTGEANLAVIFLWRLLLLVQKLGLQWAAPLGLIVLGFVLDAIMGAGLSGKIPMLGPEIARFSWTRDVVNPEYSVIETAAVFFASFHFFSLHNGAYWVDAAFSLVVLAVIFIRRDAWALARQNLHILLAFAAVVLFFTSITHAFQNARYYFFFLPVLAAIVPRNRIAPLAALGLLHVAARGLSL